MENKKIIVLYKFHSKNLAVEIRNTTNKRIEISSIHLLKHETNILVSEHIELKFIEANKAEGFYFKNVPELLEKKGLDSSSNVFIECTTSDGKKYRNLSIHYSINLNY